MPDETEPELVGQWPDNAMRIRVYEVRPDGKQRNLPLAPMPKRQPGDCIIPGCTCRDKGAETHR